MKVEANGVCNITGHAAHATYGETGCLTNIWATEYCYEKNSRCCTVTTGNDHGRAISRHPVTGDLYATGEGLNGTIL